MNHPTHSRVPITIRLETFEGPLDLLLYLIQSHELDLSRVSISKITDQYLAYVKLMQGLNFDMASEFLVMAATLLLWKSRSILPNENGEAAAAGLLDDGVLSPEELLKQLLEHQRFLAAGDELAQLPRLFEDVFPRPNRKPPTERVWREMNLSDLILSYQDTLTRQRRRKAVLKKETVSLTEKIWEFADRLTLGQVTELTNLMRDLPDRPEQVVTFLASLELVRLRKLKIHQQKTYGPIFVELLETFDNFNIALASGFSLPVESSPIGALTTQSPVETVSDQPAQA